MIFRQLFDQATSTFTYLLADPTSGDAVLIDSVFEQHLRDLALIRELGLTLRVALETHVHADHVTGAWLLKKELGCAIALSKHGGAAGADRYLDEGDVVEFGSQRLTVRATPGHTSGCLTFVSADERMAFTGDALLIRGAGRTDFQGGSPEQLFVSVRSKILSLPEDCELYPAHDYAGRTSTSVREERQHNPRLGDAVREVDFVGYMNNLGLPHPKRIDHAVPANLRCGEPMEGDALPSTPDWGPVIRTFAGVWEIEPEWVFKHRDDVFVIDVREAEEVRASSMGTVQGATVIPLSRLRAEHDRVPKDQPVVCVCPAGARSAVAAGILDKAGFERVANMRGGILAWRELGLPIGSPG